MNVPQLLNKLRFVADIEVVISLLPKVLGLANQPPRHALFERLDGVGKRSALGLTQKQVNVVRHDDVSVHAKIKTDAHALEADFEHAFGRSKRRAPPVHDPLKPKNGLNGPPAAGNPDFGVALEANFCRCADLNRVLSRLCFRPHSYATILKTEALHSRRYPCYSRVRPRQNDLLTITESV